ncbi:hypothetical protein IU449_27120 [Nocardia higoensis]|uniref:Uncharacterized protein n=1 Tax=Nocardia higoensis TaxID=228599 RepID=A0ABS0DJU3_9NOCA|nr:hypothetical protein [Nocardia higoensis]MBF6358173.1 hypothetical protein [Nocardia higoensis]
MNDLWFDVAKFNAACGVRLRETPGWVTEDELALALRLIDEERDELATALRARDMIETADAIADGLYVRAGLLLRLGIARTYITELLVPARDPLSWEDLDDVEQVIADLDADDRRIRGVVTARNLLQVDTFTHRTMHQLSALAVILRIPLDRVWGEVQRSNLAKLVDGKALRREDGKIVKPEGWQPPNIGAILYPQDQAA